MNLIIKKPSAWFPIVMSLTALTIMIIRIVMFGVPVREVDEGTGAHLFQIWLVLEVLFLSFFVIKWLPLAPKQVLKVLALQIVTALMPMAIVFFLKL